MQYGVKKKKKKGKKGKKKAMRTVNLLLIKDLLQIKWSYLVPQQIWPWHCGSGERRKRCVFPAQTPHGLWKNYLG